MTARRGPTPDSTAPPRPTLLVFTLGATAESARRPLLPRAHRDAERALRASCLDAALAAGRGAGCRLVVAAPETAAIGALLADDVERAGQTGRGFGERLERACAAAFEGGGGPLLVVGTDVPGLAEGHLRRALEAVVGDPEAVVVGPSPDGGFYLLASARPIPGLAGLTRWCRPETLALLRRALVAAGRRVILLEPLADLDRRRDLERWLAAAGRRAAVRWRGLLRRLHRLLAALRRALPRPRPMLRPATVPVRAARPPPRRRR